MKSVLIRGKNRLTAHLSEFNKGCMLYLEMNIRLTTLYLCIVLHIVLPWTSLDSELFSTGSDSENNLISKI